VLTVSPEVFAGLNQLAATPAASAPAASAPAAASTTQPVFIIAQPGMFSAPAVATTPNLRSAPAKAPAGKPAAKRSAGKKTTPKGP
jgi:hypothetical protein